MQNLQNLVNITINVGAGTFHTHHMAMCDKHHRVIFHANNQIHWLHDSTASSVNGEYLIERSHGEAAHCVRVSADCGVVAWRRTNSFEVVVHKIVPNS